MMFGGAHGEETTILSRHLDPLYLFEPTPPPSSKAGEPTLSPSSRSPLRPPTPPPPRRRRRTAHGVPPTPVLPFEVQSVVLVREPPKDLLAHSKETLVDDEESALTRVAGKSETGIQHYPSLDLDSTTAAAAAVPTTKPNRSSLTTSEDFFADLYDYYYDGDDAAEQFVFPTPKPPKPLTLSVIDHVPSTHSNPTPRPNPDPTPCDRPVTRVTKSKSVKDTSHKSTVPAMAKKRRGSLQAIFVPSFLQSPIVSTTSVPSSPTQFATNAQSKARKLSGAVPSAPTSPSGSSYAFPPSSPSFPHAQDALSPLTLVDALPPIVPLTPEMLPVPVQHERKRSNTFSISSFSSPRSSPPLDFLLDEDPFANLTGPPIERVSSTAPPPVPPLPANVISKPVPAPTPSQVPLSTTPVDPPSTVVSPVTPISPPPLPRSPLHESPPPHHASLDAAVRTSTSVSGSASSSASTSASTSSTVISASSSGSTSTSPIISAPRPPLAPLAPPKPIVQGQAVAPSSPPAGRGPALPSRARPAYQRPAFASRPSLPSLDTLARMNVVLTKKVRKGRVGAGLPFEPWDLPSDEELPSAPGTRPHTPTRVHSASPSLSSSLSTGALPTTTTTSIAAFAPVSPPISIPASDSLEDGNGADPRSSSPAISTTPTPPPAPVSPFSAPLTKPQPLLPSQIMALGSVAEDVEMFLPARPTSPVASPTLVRPTSASDPVAGPSTTSSSGTADTSQSWLSGPLSSPATGDFASEFAEEVAAELDIVSSRPTSLDGRAGQEGGSNGGYLGGLGPDYLERYHAESRRGSIIAHEGAGCLMKAAGDEESGVQEVQLHQPEMQLQAKEDDAARTDEGNEDFSYLYRHTLSFEDADGRDDDVPTGASAPDPNTSSVVPSGSMIFSSPPPYFTSPPSLSSSMSLSRSVSSTSYSSVESADSSGAVESAELDNEEREGRSGTWRRNPRRFGGQNPSLSSLELDLGMDGPLSQRDLSIGHDLRTSTRSSSSHPSLSRTRSSSEDSNDALQSPSQGDYAHFPYSRAREVYQLQQQRLLDLHSHPYSASALFGGLDGAEENERLEGWENGSGMAMFSGAATSFVQADLPTSSGRHLDDQEVSEEFALSALSGQGLSFGFGYEQLGLPETGAAEVGVEDEKMHMGSRHATNTSKLATSTKDLNTFTSSFDDRDVDDFSAPASIPTISGPFSAVDEEQHVDRNSDISLSSPTQPSTVRPGSTHLVLQASSSPLPLSDHSPSEDMTFRSSASPSMLRTSPEAVSNPRATDLDSALSFPSTSVAPLGGEMRDSSGHRSRGNSAAMTSAYRSGNSQAQSNGGAYGSSYSSSATMWSNNGFGRRNSDDEDEEDERRRQRTLQKMQHVNDATIRIKPKPRPSSSSSEDEGDGTDDYGEPSAPPTTSFLSVPRNANSLSRSPSSGESYVTASSSPSLQPQDFPSASSGSSRYASEDDRDDESDDDEDDDMPLAQRIPGALTAQKSIRRQFRQEREQRKREKGMKEGNESQAEKRARQVTLRPAGAGSGSGKNMMGSSSSQDAALLAAAAAAVASTAPPQARQRTLTLPGKPATTVHATFDPYDLTRKLQNVQLAEKSLSPQYQQQVLSNIPPTHPRHFGSSHTRSKSISRPSVDQPRQQVIALPISASPLSPPSVPTSSSLLRDRSKTVRDPASASHLRHPPPPAPAAAAPPPVAPAQVPSLRPMRSFHHSDGRPSVSSDEQRLGRSATTSRRTSNEQHGHRPQRSASRPRTSGERIDGASVPPLPISVNLGSRRSTEEQRKLVMSPTTQETRLHSARTSGEHERSHRPSNASQQQTQPLYSASKASVSHQRIFVGNLQQFYMVEIGPTTTAGDVIAVMDTQGALSGWAGSGGWMVFEVAQDFGMERPVRSYELLADIQSSWIKDKTVNFFVLKLTPLFAPLSRSAIPSSAPTYSGYVEWEAKRGKWSKRWLQLREHSLWLSKRDNGKDEIFLCSLSNFDVYHITRNHKSPKPFAFAIKSTDNLSFFENTDDYLHTFSCSEKDGNTWLEKILVARSYVLYQERHVLFSPKSSSDNGPTSTLTRSGTKKHAPSSRPVQPLVPVAPLLSPKALAGNAVFEPGSLLAKQL